MNHINPEDNVLIVWNESKQVDLTNLVNEVKSITHASVVLENSNMITANSRPPSSFDVVITNWLPPYTVLHTDDLLGTIIKLLKPCGKLIAREDSDIIINLKSNGFSKVVKWDEDYYTCEKSKFEIGASAPLKLKKPAVWKLDKTVEQAWSGAGGTNDNETIDSDTLLDENDLQTPDKKSLRVCSTTGKRKACADCSCGLAEELRGETKDTPKSSCGSCYLGDAFRCATCPYLGMPAFKPGEQVKLDLKSDI